MQVLDDIRESTRTAAVGFTKVLAQQIMRACTPDGSPDLGRLVSAVALADNTSSGGSPNTRDRKRKREGLQSTSIEATTAVLIPILLDRGLVAGSQEGRGFSLGLLVQVVKVLRVLKRYQHRSHRNFYGRFPAIHFRRISFVS